MEKTGSGRARAWIVPMMLAVVEIGPPALTVTLPMTPGRLQLLLIEARRSL
jgi:hypothetical protein